MPTKNIHTATVMEGMVARILDGRLHQATEASQPTLSCFEINKMRWRNFRWCGLARAHLYLLITSCNAR